MRDSVRFWRKLAQLLTYCLALAGCARTATFGLDPSTSGDTAGQRSVALPDSNAAAGSGCSGCAGASSAGIGLPARDAGQANFPSRAAGQANPSGSRMTPGSRPAGFCGDGVINGDEFCEVNALNSATCLTLGYAGGGLLLCNPSTCLLDTTNCRMTAWEDGGSPTQPPIVDDSGAAPCVPGGACIDDQRRICAADGQSCASCVSDAECQVAYDDVLVHCVAAVCELQGL